jgi:ketosteroid isomerase-like protein
VGRSRLLSDSLMRRACQRLTPPARCIPLDAYNSDMQRGRDAIQKWFASWLPTTRVETFEATSMEITVVGDTAYEVGTYQ